MINRRDLTSGSSSLTTISYKKDNQRSLDSCEGSIEGNTILKLPPNGKWIIPKKRIIYIFNQYWKRANSLQTCMIKSRVSREEKVFYQTFSVTVLGLPFRSKGLWKLGSEWCSAWYATSSPGRDMLKLLAIWYNNHLKIELKYL